MPSISGLDNKIDAVLACAQVTLDASLSDRARADELLTARALLGNLRGNMVRFENDIETRPMICGSMGTQPFYVKRYGRLELPNVTDVDRYGFYVPNHPKLTEGEIEFVCQTINEVINYE